MNQTVPSAPGRVDPANVEAARRRRARMQEEERRSKLVRRLVTPEGAAIRLKLATATERAGAFLIDVAIQWAIVVATALGLLFAMRAMDPGSRNMAWAMWLVFYFFVRNFYYILFELGTKAATPGKRALGIRVASRDGGRLTANSVLARNFIREIEVGLPIQFLLMGGDRVQGWVALLGLIWSGIFLLFPIFNRDKMRVGDLIAGTWVIRNPKTKLMGDISSSTKTAAHERFTFTPAQADAYGIHELHVLEDVLRQSTQDVKAQVALRIRHKIGWQPDPGETDTAFLEAYYAALRRRLEQRMLLGDRKTDKFDTR
ncbi:RDD family protein [Hyphomonas sp.]|uniref:RDD family protein n=1 Tax=Hyphomonas sp. TaxID=87 RepID=UPI0025BC7C4C|nr:RDD family protein [Hyphomonas sp.]